MVFLAACFVLFLPAGIRGQQYFKVPSCVDTG